jgi:endonuclease-3
VRDGDIHEALRRLRRSARGWPRPYVDEAADRSRDPFLVLVSCLLSLRTKDETTEAASRRLFRRARTPRRVLRLPEEEIARLVYPVGFYRTKARTLRAVSQALLDRHGGKVPDDLQVLLELPGVGRKTANLVLTAGHGRPGICVDTHVHRITNRWGYVRTRDPHGTEAALRGKLPPRHWLSINGLLVAFGQNLCKPLSPLCSRCPVADLCERRGVTRSR